MRRARIAVVALTLLGVGATGPPAAATLPIGVQLRVSNMGPDATPAFAAFAASVAYNSQANEYLVVWHGDGLPTDDESEVFGQRLSASGAELGGDFRISTTGTDGDANRDATDPAVVYNSQANEYLVAWRADALATDNEIEVFGQRLSASGAELGGDFRISKTGSDGDAARDVENPAVAYNLEANEYLIAWNGDGLATDNEHEIFGQRLSATGAELGGDFRISTTASDGDATRDATDPSVASNPQANEYLVAWEADGLPTANKQELFGQRLSATGTELGGDFRISTTGSDGDATRNAADPSVAYNPQANEYLVAWEANALATAGELEVFGQRLSASGVELGGDFRISTTGTDGDANRAARDPSVAANAQANEYLVTWHADALATDEEAEVFGQRVSATGEELGGDFRISTAGADGDPDREAIEPSLAYNPQADEYLVAWHGDGLATDDEQEIFARRLGSALPGGEPSPGGGPLPGGPAPGGEPTPTVADTTPPTLSRLALSHQRFRPGTGPTAVIGQRRRAAPKGTTFRYTLSEAATVRIAIERAGRGVKLRRRGSTRLRCVAATRANRRDLTSQLLQTTAIKRLRGRARQRALRRATRRRACTSFRRIGMLTRRNQGPGAIRTSFSGRIGQRTLTPAAYRARLSASDAAGNRSAERRLGFRVVKR